MFNLNEKINKIQSQGKYIRVAVAGIGQMGSSLIAQMQKMKVFKIVAVANRNINNSLKRLEDIGISQKDLYILSAKEESNQSYNYLSNILDFAAKSINNNLINNKNEVNNLTIHALNAIVNSNNKIDNNKFNKKILKDADQAIKNNKIIFTDEISLLSLIDSVDVVVDATGSPEAGAVSALSSIINKKHAVTLNVEADTAVGPILKKLADNFGVVYTVAAGDEPAALKELYDFAKLLGFEIVAAGKGKNNPLDRKANPDTLAEYSKIKGASPKMMTSFVDGTKSMLEMTCFSNATGLIPDCRGMHGPKVNVSDLTKVFSLKDNGGILGKKGIVDFAIGDVAPGVFLIYSTDLEILKKELKYLLFGDGPNYLLYRPFHLASMEVPISIINAVLYNDSTIAPKNGLISEVITVAKKDLKKGEVIDGIGGFTVYGLIDLYETAKKENLVPLALIEDAVIKNDIKFEKPITYDDVELKTDCLIYKLRKLQEILIS